MFQSNQPHVNEYPIDVLGKWGSIISCRDQVGYERRSTHDTMGQLMEMSNLNHHRLCRLKMYIPKRDTSPGRNRCFERGTDESFTRDIAAI